ncbi:zinc ABC transporter substrate-binding protein [Suicoccus acidiformans]|uniref:Zinc ABC transporter substrate-binding protein n=1 Tax=Suicoccus acidiformans TaxID=2036206 RepID=A0A347WN19_9LACT|nr:zinc ABC transporter substrate-binding protein [Suicoccus acidiformans]AXY26476.1 zinc ABC transporter substrate-binding protein [Suicoccus acidiformans]
MAMRKKFLNRMAGFALLVAACLSLVACTFQEDAAQSSDKPIVYASFYPIYDLLADLSGDTVEVRYFMPIEKSPHEWEPTPKDMKKLSEADLLVVNGANMEKWVADVQENLPDLDILILSEKADLITYKGAAAIGDFQYLAKLSLEAGESYSLQFGHTHENLLRFAMFQSDKQDADLIEAGKTIMEDKGEVVVQHADLSIEPEQVYGVEMGHESGQINFAVPESGDWYFVCDRISEKILSYQLLDQQGEQLQAEAILEGSSSTGDQVTYDPHSWLSVTNAKRYINTIQDKLIELYPEHERTYQKNKFKLTDQLTKMEVAYRTKFKECKTNKFVSTHNAYEYLAKDFNLDQYPLQDLVSTETPSLKATRAAILYCQANNIDTIFYEYGASDKAARTLADEIKGQVQPLASMEYATNIESIEDASYLNLIQFNLENLYQSMR